jgi:Flp pilus assembly protein TadD
VGRAELLAAVGYLGAVLAYLAEGRAAMTRAGGGRRVALAAVTIGAAALAFGSKEHALTLPVVLLLADAWAARASGGSLRPAMERHGITWGTVAGLAAVYLLWRSAVLGAALGAGYAAPGLEELDVAGRAVAMLPVVLVWLRLFAFPLHLSADYSPEVIVPAVALTWRHVAGFVVLVTAVVAAWRWRRSLPAFTAGIVWCAVTMAPTANVLVPAGVLTGERLLYLPSVGVAFVVAALWSAVAARPWVWPVTVAVLVLLAARAVERTRVWRDADAFFAARVRDAPASYRSHWQLGDRAFAAGDPASGERELLTALRINPLDANLLRDLAQRYHGIGRFGPADRYASAALAVDPSYAAAALLAILARLGDGRAAAAAALADSVLPRFPEDEVLALAAVRAYTDAGAGGRAAAVAWSLARQRPTQWAYQLIAGDAAVRLGRCDEARAWLSRAAALAPSEVAPRERLAGLGSGPGCSRP